MDHGGIDIDNLFRSDTPIWALLGRMADIAILSLLWTVCSVPVITLGAASAALMRCVNNMVSEEGNWRARHFFRYFRSNFRNATLLWLVFLVAGGLFILDIIILHGADSISARVQMIAAVIGLILWMITAVWAFAITSLFDSSLLQTVRNSFILGISWLPRTLLMSFIWLIPAALLAFAPAILSRIIVLWPALFTGGTAWICARLMARPLAPYTGYGNVQDEYGDDHPDDTPDDALDGLL